MIQLNDLPNEILEFILSYLPPYKDLEICRNVCKRWDEAVENVLHRGKINFLKGLTDYYLCWTTHTSSKILPSGRFSHAYCVHEDSMYIFGGGSSSDTTFNDLWRFDLSKRQWVRPITMGSYPSPKGSATMIPYENKLILFGGWRYPSFHPPHQPWCLFDELHCYDIAENRWIVQTSLITPPLMAGHSASLHGDQMVIFGGYQCDNGQNTNSNDVWSLDLKTFQWRKPIIVVTSINSRPAPRYGQMQIALDENHLMIMGGSGGFNNLFSDCWILDMTKDAWQWHNIPVKNRKWAATHMWNSPACRIGNKIIVCGPTPSVPPDLQILKQRTNNTFNGIGPERLLRAHNDDLVNIERNRFRMHDMNHIQGENVEIHRQDAGARIIDNNAQQQLLNNNIPVRNNIQNIPNNEINDRNRNNNINCNSINNNYDNDDGNQNLQVQPQLGQINQIPGSKIFISRENSVSQNPLPSQNISPSSPRYQVQNQQGLNEAVNRLQRNLALRARDNDMKLPLRFNEQQDGRICMAAFNVQQNNPIQIQKEYRQQERVRRLNEKLNQFRNAKKKQEAAAAEAAAVANKTNNEEKDQQQLQPNRPVNNSQYHQKQQLEEPKPKRAKRNVLGMFVCDISNILNVKEPFLEWLEYKNYGILSGAPERLIFASMIPGKNELILFGGVQKESLCSKQHKVSNFIHFLSVPKEII